MDRVWEVGNQPRWTEKTMTIMRASQKPGMAYTTRDPMVTALSRAVYCFTAAMMPRRIPRKASKRVARIVSWRV